MGAALAAGLEPGLTIYMSGELGAGKTTLARGILRGLGHAGRVKSPSFALVEPYTFSKLYLYHFDFYRFTDPRELGDAGFRDYFNPDSVCLVEWPENAAGMLIRRRRAHQTISPPKKRSSSRTFSTSIGARVSIAIKLAFCLKA